MDMREMMEELSRRVDIARYMQGLIDLHCDESFAGFTWIVPSDFIRAMEINDIRWLDEQWRFVEKFVSARVAFFPTPARTGDPF